MKPTSDFFYEEPTEVSQPELTPLPDFRPPPAPPLPRPYYGILITFGRTDLPESGRILPIPTHVHSLPALVWHTFKTIWRHRNLLRGRA